MRGWKKNVCTGIEVDLNISMVHIDDVARAHIFLLEHPDAKGRYNCSTQTISHQKIAEILSANYPEFPIPTAEWVKSFPSAFFSIIQTYIIQSWTNSRFSPTSSFLGSSLAEIKGMKVPGLSSKKLLDTGFKFKYGVEEMFDGAIKCCKERGYL